MWNNSNEEQLIEGVLRHGPEILKKSISDCRSVDLYLERISLEYLHYPFPKKQFEGIEWMIPQEYKEFDIENWLLCQCTEIIEYNRIETELALYRKNNMIPVLKTMKYIVDTLRKNNIVWGVGRGSSVASYALYLIGIHKINSVKYNLPIEEFFKEI
jgi:DNA polymerase III alpha subunit